MSLQQSNSWQALSAALPEGERIYAIGGIHGCDALLAQIHERIALDRRLRTIRRATLVYLGNYVGHGPASRLVVDRVLDTPSWADSVVRLLGRSEALFLDALASEPLTNDFFKAGGLETLRSYGEGQDSLLRVAAQKEVFEAARAKIPTNHLEFLRDGIDRFVLGDFFFCPAGVRPGVPLGRQSRADVQSNSREFLESKADFGAFIVHGQNRCAAPELRSNRINLDTGASTSGRLTCGVFEDNRVRFVATGALGGVTKAGRLRSRVAD